MGENVKRYPLTSSQLSIWMGQKMAPGSPLYNMAFTFDIQGSLKRDVFNESFNRVIAHYDALRIVFGEDSDHQPFQWVLPEYHYDLDLKDLSLESDPQPSIDKLVDAGLNEKFVFSRPLFNSFLIKTSNQRTIWFLNVHHLVTDITSIQLIYRKTAAYYQQTLAGQSRTEEVESFLELVTYERQCKEDPSKKPQYDFWRNYTQSTAALPRLYGQQKEPNTNSKRVQVAFGAEQSAELQRLAALKPFKSLNEDLTKYLILSTILAAFIHKVTGDHTITIGSPTYNRPSSKFRTIAGLFIDVLPFRVAIDEKETFLSLFVKVRKSIYDMLQNTVPGVAIAELNREIGVVLNYITIRFGAFGDIPAHTTWLDTYHIDKNHRLRLQVFDLNDEGLELHLDVNTSVFSTGQVERIPKHFSNLIHAFLEDRDQSLESIRLPDNEESNDLNKRINTIDRQAMPAINLVESFGHACQYYGKDTAVAHDGQRVIYDQLDRDSNRLAHYLHARGIGKGCRVAVQLRRSIPFVTSVLGILKSGACYVPIPTDYPPQRVRDILEDVQPSLWLTESSLTDQPKDIDIPAEVLKDTWQKMQTYPDHWDHAQPGQDDPAYIMYTSGSTGKPKGVIISHGALGNYLAAAKDLYLGEQKAIAPLFTSIGFDLTVTSLFLPLLSGGSIRIYEEDPSGHDLSVLKVIEDEEINFIKLTPSHARLIVDLDVAHSNIRTMLLGGEDLHRDLADRISNAFGHAISIYNEYGPTEGTVGCIVKKYNPEEASRCFGAHWAAFCQRHSIHPGCGHEPGARRCAR